MCFTNRMLHTAQAFKILIFFGGYATYFGTKVSVFQTKLLSPSSIQEGKLSSGN